MKTESKTSVINSCAPAPWQWLFRAWGIGPVIQGQSSPEEISITSKEEVIVAAKFSSARGGARVEAGILQQRWHTSWGIWKEGKETMLKCCYIPAPISGAKMAKASFRHFLKKISFTTTYNSTRYALNSVLSWSFSKGKLNLHPEKSIAYWVAFPLMWCCELYCWLEILE